MFATRSLFRACNLTVYTPNSCRITLFTRNNCSLCADAKGVLGRLSSKRPFIYKEVNLAQPESEAWRNLYDFDIPVIHIAKADTPEEQPDSIEKIAKLKHRFTVEQVKEAMDRVGKE